MPQVHSIIDELQKNAALWISLLALLTTVLHGFATRRHNRLSVKPSLRIDKKSVLSEESGIDIINVGVGPAIIKSVRIQVLGEALQDTGDDWGTKAIELLVSKKHVPQGLNVITRSLQPGETLAPNERLLLVGFLDEHNQGIELQEAHLLYSSFIKWLNIRVTYTSVYGEKFIAET